MSDNPYIPFYTSDFLGGTSGLTAAQRGVYITIICMIYEAEGPLAQKWDTLARRCGATLPAFKSAISALEDDGKIEVSENGIWSKKCEKHLAHRRHRQRSAKAAAKTRWEKTQQKQRPSEANACSSQCQPEPEPDISKGPNGPLSELPPPIDEISEAVSAYNTAAERAGWSKVQKMTPARRASLKARMKEAGGPEGWRLALEKAEASDFLCGRKPIRGDPFFASFDFLTRQSKFTMLMEGSYDNRTQQAGPANQHGNGSSAAVEQALRLAGLEGTSRMSGNGT